MYFFFIYDVKRKQTERVYLIDEKKTWNCSGGWQPCKSAAMFLEVTYVVAD